MVRVVGFARAFLVFIAALLLSVGVAVPAGAAQAGAAGAADHASVSAAAAQGTSETAALAARRTLVQHTTSRADERAAGHAIARHLKRKATKPELQALAAQERGSNPRRTQNGSRDLAQTAPYASLPAATAASSDAVPVIDDWVLSGPTGAISEACLKLCGEIVLTHGNVYPGESLTQTIGAIWVDDPDSTASEDVTITWSVACGDESLTDIGSETSACSVPRQHYWDASHSILQLHRPVFVPRCIPGRIAKLQRQRLRGRFWIDC